MSATTGWVMAGAADPKPYAYPSPMQPFMPFPMMHWLPMPGMMPPMGGKGPGGPMPPMPPMMPCFPHPAQLQAMSAAAQAAMAQAAGKPGTQPFGVGMMMGPMQQQQAAPVQQAPVPASTTAAHVAAGSWQPTATAAAAKAADATMDRDTADDDVVIVDDEDDDEVDPELEKIFEKVAAMEREQVQRASSPCASIHSASTALACSNHNNSTNPCSPSYAVAGPVSPAVFDEAAAGAAAAAAGVETAPAVPWLSFAADDKVDDLDKDLAQIFNLQDDSGMQEAPRSSAMPASAAMPAAATLKRVSSTASAQSSGEVLAGPAAAIMAQDAAAAAAPAGASSKGKKVLRIRGIKGAVAAAIGSNGSKASKAGSSTPAGKPSVKTDSGSSQQQQRPASAAASGLGVKSGVQKRSGTISSGSSKLSKSKAGIPRSPAKQQQQPAAALAEKCSAEPAAADEACLSLLGELDSGLSDACFGSNASFDPSCTAGDDVMGIDSFDYLGDLMLPETSEEACWGGLLASTDMELCSDLAV